MFNFCFSSRNISVKHAQGIVPNSTLKFCLKLLHTMSYTITIHQGMKIAGSVKQSSQQKVYVCTTFRELLFQVFIKQSLLVHNDHVLIASNKHVISKHHRRLTSSSLCKHFVSLSFAHRDIQRYPRVKIRPT